VTIASVSQPRDKIRCRRCRRALTGATAVETVAGVLCAKHADRLPPYLFRQRPGRGGGR
jgi:hypothetical protein